MENSTPDVQNPSKRRFAKSSDAQVINKVDDVAERIHRRRSRGEKQVTTTPQRTTSTGETSLSEEELKAHFHFCMTLFMGNKINANNVWNLNLINNLDKLKDSLQVAGTSLDISARIYGIRVDDVHAFSMKLASMLMEAQTNNRDEQMNGVVEAETSFEQGKEKKQKKKRYRRGAPGEKPTIANCETNCAPIKTLDSNLFHSVNEAALGAIESLFTNTFPTDHSGYKFLFKGESKVMVSKDDKDLTFEHQKQLPFPISTVKNMQICQTFHDFDMLIWNPDDYICFPDEPSVRHDNKHDGDAVAFDDEGIPIPELDGSINDIFENGGDNVFEEPPMETDQETINQMVTGHRRNSSSRLLSVRPLTVRNTEYSYNTVFSTHSGKVLDCLWAGPSHWKLKYNRPSVARFSGRQSAKPEKLLKRKREKVKDLSIDFDVPDLDLRKVVKIIKRSTNADVAKITLPKLEYVPQEMMSNKHLLMLKPAFTMVHHGESKLESDSLSAVSEAPMNDFNNDDIEDIEVDNIENYVPANCANDEVGDLDVENFVKPPEMVQKSNLHYVQRAKVMDMKKLKGAVWIIIEDSNKIKNQQNNEHVKNDIGVTFSHIFKQLPSHLSEKMKSELSCPLAFFALLHLANEHNLALQPRTDKSDLCITEAK